MCRSGYRLHGGPHSCPASPGARRPAGGAACPSSRISAARASISARARLAEPKQSSRSPLSNTSIVGQVLVLVGAVGLEAEALVPDGRRAEPGAGAVAGGGVEGRAVEHDVGGAVAAVAADEGFNIGCIISVPPLRAASPPEMPAGRRLRRGAGWCSSGCAGSAPSMRRRRGRRWGGISCWQSRRASSPRR